MKHVISTLTDDEGFLLDSQRWSEDIAAQLANTENLNLGAKHWEFIYFLRAYYKNYQHIPTMRLLIKAIAKTLGKEKASSPYLYELFPGGPIKQGCKIAGLNKPPHCI